MDKDSRGVIPEGELYSVRSTLIQIETGSDVVFQEGIFNKKEKIKLSNFILLSSTNFARLSMIGMNFSSKKDFEVMKWCFAVQGGKDPEENIKLYQESDYLEPIISYGVNDNFAFEVSKGMMVMVLLGKGLKNASGIKLAQENIGSYTKFINFYSRYLQSIFSNYNQSKIDLDKKLDFDEYFPTMWFIGNCGLLLGLKYPEFVKKMIGITPEYKDRDGYLSDKEEVDVLSLDFLNWASENCPYIFSKYEDKWDKLVKDLGF